MSNETLVIGTQHMDHVVAFFTKLGFVFEKEQHGNGPVHYSFEKDGDVLEIYPSRGSTVFFYEEKT